VVFLLLAVFSIARAVLARMKKSKATP